LKQGAWILALRRHNFVKDRESPGVGTVSFPTTRIERLLLVASVALLPLDGHVPTVIMGFSFMSFVFAAIAIYALLKRAPMVGRVLMHPVFIAAYAFLLVISLIELTHPYADYSEILRIVQMFIGAVLIASLCRDQQALRAGLAGCLIAGLWVSIYLIMTGYSNINAMTAEDFGEASQVRSTAFQNAGFHSNLNGLAFYAGQGVIGALALGLKQPSSSRVMLFLVVALTCVVGVFLTMSRGGVMILVVGCAAIIWTSGLLSARTLVALALLTIGIWLVVPEATFSRLVYKRQFYYDGTAEARTQVYSMVIDQVPEYILTGVGVGNFWQSWGRKHGFGRGHGVLGSHNGFAQTTIYWGIGGLLGLLAVIGQVWRYFPRPCSTNSLNLWVFGMSPAVLSLMIITHNLYGKEFSLALGFMVGAGLWIWPSHGGIRTRASQMTITSLASR
jgi:O-antigen ligase